MYLSFYTGSSLSDKLYLIFLFLSILAWGYSMWLDYHQREELEKKYYAESQEIENRHRKAIETFSLYVKAINESAEKLELRIHELVNELRNKSGLKPLQFDRRLQQIARYHSRDMAINDYFDHTSPKGETFLDRYRLFNYECEIKVVVKNETKIIPLGSGEVVWGTSTVYNIYTGGENIALVYIYDSAEYVDYKVVSYKFKTLEEIARSVVDGWYQSEGHRKNMLFPHWQREGIGIYITSDGKVYVTQNFC